MDHKTARAALATSAVDVSSFAATSPAGGVGNSPARRPGIGPDTDRQPRPQNG